MNLRLHKFEQQCAFHCRIRGIMPTVVQFTGVCFQVKEFAIVGIAIDRYLVLVGH